MPERPWPRGAVLLGALAAATLAAPWLAPFDPAQQLDVVHLKNLAPSLAHPLGTDAFSRDVLSRALFGGRTSLTMAVLATGVAFVAGGVWGALAAMLGGRLGAALMTVTDVARSVPRLLLFLAVLVVAGPLEPVMLAMVLGGVAWTGMAHLVHALVREGLARPYVEAAMALGTTRWRCLVRHVAPHLTSPLTAAGALLFADILAVEAGLSFIGLGVRPPGASWGGMLQDALPFMRSAPWLTATPCALLVATVLGAASVADRLDASSRAR